MSQAQTAIAEPVSGKEDAMNSFKPWQELERLRNDMDLMLDRYSGTTPWRLAFLPGRGARKYPQLNVIEDEARYEVEALAPGVDPDTITLSVQDNTLTISGEKKPAEDLRPEDYHRSERSVGKFVRSVQLPDHVDQDKVKAKYREGILTVVLEKSEAAKPRQIPVEVG
ncbi:MAG: Hsp20/alpha crystallin family protein [bacterium]|nr:MAG: Hsp20/alpha crystallin family protein [bacterium]